jgi:hypothetical protein
MSQEATVAAKELLDHGDEFFGRTPTLTTLHITDTAGLLEALARVPHFG